MTPDCRTGPSRPAPNEPCPATRSPSVRTAAMAGLNSIFAAGQRQLLRQLEAANAAAVLSSLRLAKEQRVLGPADDPSAFVTLARFQEDLNVVGATMATSPRPKPAEPNAVRIDPNPHRRSRHIRDRTHHGRRPYTHSPPTGRCPGGHRRRRRADPHPGRRHDRRPPHARRLGRLRRLRAQRRPGPRTASLSTLGPGPVEPPRRPNSPTPATIAMPPPTPISRSPAIAAAPRWPSRPPTRSRRSPSAINDRPRPPAWSPR